MLHIFDQIDCAIFVFEGLEHIFERLAFSFLDGGGTVLAAHFLARPGHGFVVSVDNVDATWQFARRFNKVPPLDLGETVDNVIDVPVVVVNLFDLFESKIVIDGFVIASILKGLACAALDDVDYNLGIIVD